MPPNTLDDQDRLAHILAECEFLLSITPELSIRKIDNNEIMRRALCYSFVIIGEASHHLSNDFKKTYSGIDWQLAYLMRNILVHSYESIDCLILLDTIIKEIPKLHSTLQ